MLPELGLYALILAFMLSVLQAIIPMWGSFYRNKQMMRLARPLSIGQFCFVLISFSVLMYAFIVNDFSVQYVAENSNTHLPLIFRVAALWGAHEGSMLLWVMILSFWTILVAICAKKVPLNVLAEVLAVLGMISSGFLLFILCTSNPFSRLLNPMPIQGRDLNPLLQDIGLASHPPILYMGYVGFAVAFAFAISALVNGKVDKKWIQFTRPFVVAAWCFLTAGIILGSMWSYRVLGWGGWWAWDPVENASFMPWLCGTALIHALIVSEKTHNFSGWTVLLAIFTFSLSLFGTFLVRSGILSSVHTFAQDPERGAYMLGFLALVVGASLTLYVARAHKLSASSQFSLLSKETLLLSNNIILVVMLLTLLIGTLYPLFIDALHAGKISVGPAYFNTVFIPLSIPLVLFLGLATAIDWKSMRFKTLAAKCIVVFILCIVACIGLWFVFANGHHLALIGVVSGIWIILMSIKALFVRSKKTGINAKDTRFLGMITAHIGVGLLVIAISLNMSLSLEKEVILSPGEEVKLGDYRLQMAQEVNRIGPNYKAQEVNFKLFDDNRYITTLSPQKRFFNASGYALSKAAIKPFWLNDVYLALGSKLNTHGAWSMRLYDKPFVRWIWAGGLLMILGGLLTLINRNKPSPGAKT